MQSHLTSGRISWCALQRHVASIIVAGSLAVIGANTANAQDASALVEKLIKKGILTEKEGTEVRTDMQKEFSQTSAGKLKLSDSVSKLKLYGDLTLFWQYNDNERQINDGSHLNQQSRFRYRLRLNADIELGPEWFAGLQLQTGQTPDAAKQTYSNGFNNDNIFISRAYLGWHNDWLKVVAGKQANPIYTTDLVWDPDINPAGLTETIAFHKMPLFGGSHGPGGDGKDVKSAVDAVPYVSPWEITFVAGQFIFGDNNEFNNTGDLSSDPWIFDQQLIVTYKFNKDTSITVAPGLFVESAGHVTGALNSLPFADENAISSGTTAVQTTVQDQDVVAITYNAAGVPTRTVTPLTTTTTAQTTLTPNNRTVGSATVSGPRTITSTAVAVRKGGAFAATGAASGLPNDPSKANQSFTTTINKQDQTVSTTNNVTLPAVTGETRALHLLTAPGDISFKIGGLKSKLYWDVAYNVSGRNRYDNVYQLKDFGSREYKTRDALAWVVGLQLGQTKKKGDWSAYLNYREMGIASVDPNLNDNEIAGSSLNSRGFKLGLAYQLADAVVIQATGYLYWNLDNNLFGGRATSVGGIAPYNTYNELQLDISIKF